MGKTVCPSLLPTVLSVTGWIDPQTTGLKSPRCVWCGSFCCTGGCFLPLSCKSIVPDACALAGIQLLHWLVHSEIVVVILMHKYGAGTNVDPICLVECFCNRRPGVTFTS